MCHGDINKNMLAFCSLLPLLFHTEETKTPDVFTKFWYPWESQFKLLGCSKLVSALHKKKHRVHVSYIWPCFIAGYCGKVTCVFHCGVMDGIE